MTIKVYYFNYYGRAEATRMMLCKAGVPFEDCSLTPEEFGKMKAEGRFEYGSVPMVELDDGTCICQEQGINAYFACKYGFTCTDHNDIYTMQVVSECYKDYSAHV